MSWQDKIQNDLKITTGDGITYTPLWKDATEEINYNIEGFDFINQNGTFVERKKKQGNKLPLDFYFQGEDNIEQTDAFIQSANDSRPWVIVHPLYGQKTVQPLGIKRDDTQLNSTKISCTVWETLDRKLPLEVVSIPKEIESLSAEINLNAINSLPLEGVTSATSAVQSVSAITNAYNNLAKGIEQVQDYQDRVRKATSAAQNIISDFEGYAREIQNLINFPFIIAQDVKFAISSMVEAFKNLPLDFDLYQVNGSAMIGAICTTSSVSAFESREVVAEISELITETYETYRDTVLNPSFEVSQDLDNITYTTLAGLTDIAFSSKQERSFILLAEDNIARLAYRFFGEGDDALEKFVLINKIAYNEYLGLEKGREIIYFV
jgi:hypothetical protein